MRLQRVDYLQVGALKCDASLRVLSARGGKFQQRFVVGDQRGLLQVVAVKKSQPYADFQIDLAAPINCLVLATHAGTSTEMIVAASSQTLYAFNRKGKALFTLETNLVEPIQHLCVTDNEDILVANSYVYNHYRDTKEVNYYLSTDKINALAVLPTRKVPSLTPLLACQDSTVYSLRDSSIRHQLPLDGIPTVIQLFHADGGTSGEWIVFGTSCGRIGLVCWSRAGPSVQWILSPSAQSNAAVTSLDFYELNDSGHQLIVGRDDGTVQVYELAGQTSASGETVDTHATPSCVFSQNYNDSIAAVRGAVIGVNGCPEILVATHHGWIFGLTTDLSTSGQTRDEVIGASEALTALANQRRDQLQALKAQVAHLETQVGEIRGRFSADCSQPALMNQFNITANMSYSADENLYLISVESQVSIDYCLVHCDSKVDVLDVERNLAILSLTKTDKDQVAATFRCQANTTRLDVKIGSRESSACRRVRLYISPNISPPCAIKKTFDLPCLSHHVRCHGFQWNDRPYNQLTFKGPFTLADVHSWIHSCLPNVSEKVPPEDEIAFYFAHSQWKTLLLCRYKKGEATFQSDNIATLSLIRQFVSKRATSKNMHLNISTESVSEATDQLLQRIHPDLLKEMERRKRIQLARALGDVVTNQKAQNSTDQWISDEFQQILDAGIEEQADKIDLYLDFLLELYASHRASEGQNNPHQQLLRDQLLSYTTDQLLDMFSALKGPTKSRESADHMLTFTC